MADSWNESLLIAQANNAVAMQKAYETFNLVVPTDQDKF